MEPIRLENIIRQYVQLPVAPSKKGWFQVLCPVCGDRGHKGKRAGFKFDGDKVAYHCFNCSCSTVFDPTIMLNMPHRMKEVLTAFNIDEDVWDPVLFTALQLQHNGVTSKDAPKPTNIEPMAIPVPETFYSLREAVPNDKWAIIAQHYLQTERGIDSNSYPFMLSAPTNIPHLKKWVGRVIIPIYKGEKLIFFMGRDLTGKKLKKYESPAVSRDKVLYGFDRLFKDHTLPLYIVEGWFDAFVINGVAILGNQISDSQTEWLNRSHRIKVYVPDRFGNGHIAANTALEQGWNISIPDTPDCKDISEAVQKYGKLYVMKSLIDNTCNGFEAKVKLATLIK